MKNYLYSVIAILLLAIIKIMRLLKKRKMTIPLYFLFVLVQRK